MHLRVEGVVSLFPGLEPKPISGTKQGDSVGRLWCHILRILGPVARSPYSLHPLGKAIMG